MRNSAHHIQPPRADSRRVGRASWLFIREICRYAEVYLRLTWPFIFGQLALYYFFTKTGQGREILLDSTVITNDQPTNNVINFLGIGFGFFIAAMISAWICWVMTRSVISLAPNSLRMMLIDNCMPLTARRLPYFFSYKMACFSSVIFLALIGQWLFFNADPSRHSAKYLLLAVALIAAFIALFWRLRLKHAEHLRTFFLITAPILFILACLWPTPIALWIARYFGVYTIAFIGGLFLMGLAALVVGWGHRISFPLLGVAMVMLVLYLSPLKANLHEVSCPYNDCVVPQHFPSDFADAVTRWMAANATAHPRTMVLVAVAGGGVRAAYWSASVLGAIADKEPNFFQKIFAASAVSGGALGSAGFVALGPAKPHCYVKNRPSDKFQDCLTAFLAHDFMSPVIGSFLTGDLVRRVLPATSLVDRADALEGAWEDAWDEAIGSHQFARPFDELWPVPGEGQVAEYRPNLLLNGTLAYAGERSGERAVTSNLRLKEALNPDKQASDPDIVNPAALKRLSLSTAIDNSTRFPLVEPAGAVTANAAEPPGGPRQTYYIVDGGYFDNYGAATMLELLNGGLSHRRDELKLDQLIIIQISSNAHISAKLDAHSGSLDRASVEAVCRAEIKPSQPSSELMMAYDTAMAAREWSGLAYAEQLKNWRHEHRDFRAKYFHFGLKDIDPPLGWSLSDQWRRCIDQQLKPGGVADRQMNCLVRVLNSPPNSKTDDCADGG